MYKVIRLCGNDKEYLSIDLCQILKQIVNGDLYFWKVLWISGFGKTKNNVTIMTLEDQINNSKEGILYTWETLFEFTTGTLQLEEFLLLGDVDFKKLCRYEDEKIMRQNCEFCIELIDSSFWEITSFNSFFIDNVKMNIKN